MNMIAGVNTRILREYRSWSQEQLADISGVTTRTVQRVEAGQGATADTLMAVARALETSVENLCTDWIAKTAEHYGVSPGDLTPELLAQKRREEFEAVKATYRLVEVKRVTAAHEFAPLASCELLSFEVVSGSEAARDVAVEFQEYMQDRADIWSELGPGERRQSDKDAFAYVRRLEACGCAVSVGVEAKVRLTLELSPGRPVVCSVAYVVVTLESDAKPYVGIERGQPAKML